MTFSETWKGLSGQSWGILWKTALAKLPRLAPREALYLTNPLGPYPHIIQLPSRQEGRTIPLYVFIPYQVTKDLGKSPPIIVDFHGGGFFLGTCLEEAPFCGRLARDLDSIVLTVDYRMGPVNKFPTANEDAEDVMNAVLDPSTRAGIELRQNITQYILKKRLEVQVKAVHKEYKELSKEQKHNFKHEQKHAAKEQKTLEKEQKALDKKLAKAHSHEQGHPDSQSVSDSESLKRSSTGQSSLSKGPSRQSLDSQRHPNEPDYMEFDTSRVAVAGASSGGNLALNMALDVDTPLVDTKWPCVFKPDYAHPIAFLLYFPSFDARQLPSERTRPEKMPIPKGVWASMNDALMPTYLPRDQAGHPRASPGLASVAAGLHPQARMQLILCEVDNLAEQSEAWVAKVKAEGRGDDLIVERYEGMKHGWTHIPEMALSEEERSTRNDALHKSVEFVKRVWAGQPIQV